jgi:hypothetical protein
LLGSLLVVASLVRLPRLQTSLWLDEGFSFSAATQLNGFDAQRPLYFLLLRAWISVGRSEFWLRLPSMLLGVACVALVFAIGRRLAGTLSAALAASFMALSTPGVFHSQEARMYSLAPFLLLAAAYFWLRYLEERSRRMLLCHALVGYLALLTFPLVSLGLGSLWLLEAFRSRHTPRSLVPVATVALALGLAWAPFVIVGLLNRWGIAWLQRPRGSAWFELNGWAFASLSPFDLELPEPLGLVLSACVLGLAIFGAALPRLRGIALAYFGIVSVLFVASLSLKPLWMPRYFTPFLPALYLLTAAGIARVAERSRAAAAVAAAALAAVQLVCAGASAARGSLEDWRGVAAELSALARPSDRVVVSVLPLEPTETGVWSYYYAGEAASLHFNAQSVEDWLEKIETVRRESSVPARLWLVLCASNLDPGVQRALVAKLKQVYRVEHVAFTGIDRLRID